MGDAPRPPEANCGLPDRLTNRIEDSDGEPARSAARMRRKTAPRKGRASPKHDIDRAQFNVMSCPQPQLREVGRSACTPVKAA